MNGKKAKAIRRTAQDLVQEPKKYFRHRGDNRIEVAGTRKAIKKLKKIFNLRKKGEEHAIRAIQETKQISQQETRNRRDLLRQPT